jgi:hypothetical protein
MYLHGGGHATEMSPLHRAFIARLVRASGWEALNSVGHRIRVVDVDPGEKVTGAGLYADGYTGRARMVVDEDHGYLLGVTMIGPGGRGAAPLGHRRGRRPGSRQPAGRSAPAITAAKRHSRPQSATSHD